MSAETGRRVLYLSYDGMTDPLGASQVLPYMMGLAALGHRITLLSLEKPTAGFTAHALVRQQCAAAGISWWPLPYRSRFPVASAVANVIALTRAARAVLARQSHDIVHCRSYMAAIAGRAMKRRFGVRFLFDMRGFWAEERLEGGGWGRPPFGVVYRYFKRQERHFFREADAIVSLTAAARDQMAARAAGDCPLANVTVIPCCVDFDLFVAPTGAQRRATREMLGIAPDALVVGYLGSIGGNYMLDEMLCWFAALRSQRPNARMLFVTRNPPGQIHAAAERLGVASCEIVVRAATRDQVPQLIGIANVGIAFKQPSFSALACSPTKLGEMLALGIPMVVNSGVGDVDAVARESGAAIVVDTFDQDALSRSAAEFLAQRMDAADIRAAARRRFELADGVAAYDSLYSTLRA
jgi:glycosyltransferase involved in cell wall biosynthesis